MVDAFPDDPQAFETLGEAQICKAQCVEAWGTFSRAIEMGSPASVMGAAETCMKRLVVNGSCKEATSQARQLVEVAPKSAFAHTILAQALSCQSSCAERLVVLAKAVKLGASSDLLKDPDLSCIDTLIEQKACSAALDEISQALTVLPRSASLYMSQAKAQTCAGECASAWDSFDRAARLGADTSNHREAQQCMARLIRSGDCETSQAQATQIVRGHTKSAEAQALYASAMECSGSCVESFIAWDKAVRLGGSETLATKGSSCLESMMKAGRCDDVTTEVQTLLKSFPKRAELYALLGDSQTCQEDCVGAWKSYGKAGVYGASAEVSDGGSQCLSGLIKRGQCDTALDQALVLS
jgi:predicted Zn-dependent protease